MRRVDVRSQLLFHVFIGLVEILSMAFDMSDEMLARYDTLERME